MLNRLLAAVLLGLSAFASLAATALAPTDWPQWRGPGRDGQVAGTNWPASLQGDRLKPLWRLELAPSFSGPLVVGDRVFVTETKDKRQEIVRALDRKTGRELWRQEWEGALSVPFFAKSSGDWIRATPACNGTHLFVAGMRDVLVCLEVATGAVRWRYDFVKELGAPLPDFGFVCSPLLDGEAVYVQAGASLVKLDQQSGKLIWRTLKDAGGMYGSVFSSPIIASLAGQRQLIAQTRTTLAGVNLADGTVLWSQPVEAFRGMNILTPVVFEDQVFTSTYGGKTIGFKVAQEAGKFSVTPAWQHKAQGNMSTPVVIRGVAYHHLKSQRVMAVDLRAGTELWTSPGSFGRYWNLVAQGDKILALDQRGMLVLLRANPEKFEQLDSRKVAEAETWGHLAVSGKELFIRELNAVAAYRWEEPVAAPAGVN